MGGDYEVLLVMDGSGDESWNCITRVCAEDPVSARALIGALRRDPARDAVVAASCKIQSQAFVCTGVEIGDEVFVGQGRSSSS